MAAPSSVADEDLDTRRLMTGVNSRIIKVAIMASAAVLGMVIVLVMLMPLKRAVPYVVQVNKTTGEVSVPVDQNVAQFNPTWTNTQYFLRRWIDDMFTINQYLTVNVTDPRAQAFIRGGNAISEYKAFRSDDHTFDRLVSDPSMVRDVKILTLTKVAGTKNGVVAQVSLTTHAKGHVKTVTKLVTIYYIFLHSSDIQTLRTNPIGLYITDFKVSDA